MKAVLKYPLYRRPQATNLVEAVGYLPEGSVIDVEQIIYGDAIDGVNTWYKAVDGFHYWEGGIDIPAIPTANLRSNSLFFEEYRIKEFWEKGIDGRGVNIAIIDADFSTAHPALKNFRVVNGFKNDSLNTNMHGTYMASIIGGSNFESGYFGIAPNANFHLSGLGEIKIIDFERFHKTIRGFESIDIISISFNKGANEFGLKKNIDAFNEINSRAIICASAGNNGQVKNYETYPVCYQKCVAISGYQTNAPLVLNTMSNYLLSKTDKTITHAYENYFNAATPSSFFGTGISFNGTSPATAFTAGVFALIICAKKQLNESYELGELISNYFIQTEIFEKKDNGLSKAGLAYLINKNAFFSLLK